VAVDVNSNGRKSADDKNLDAGAARALGLSAGWSVFSYLMAGMVAYGAIGWVIGKAVHVSLLFPVGMLVGLAISVGYVIYRYGRQDSVEHLYGEQARVERNDR
jgi:ATP synthase protein I